MEYSATEKKALDILRRTDFKSIKKDEMLSITSMLSNLRPEVVMEAIKQFPELSKLLQVSISEYKGILDKVIESDDSSIHKVYDAANKAIDDATSGREQFYMFAEKVRADYSKCLDKDNMTSEERAEVLRNEMEILRIVDAKEKEVREQQGKTLNIVDHKDSEKRHFNWGVIGAASAALITAVGFGIGILGGKVDLKLPFRK